MYIREHVFNKTDMVTRAAHIDRACKFKALNFKSHDVVEEYNSGNIVGTEFQPPDVFQNSSLV
jgi:hypothetical protein